ncbi:MAG: hypothetical protein AUG51_19940 [Acidobacteria bacterium 13_1_20CM_3_53_8]|nr:MAG: hypothetical protein AUG51_19940 [Acidobacteria bacterium 13_1_20CM_3_53_8]
MPDVNVNFMHPTDGRVITVTVDDTMTAQEAIGELLANNFVPPHDQGYQLSVVESGNIIADNQTMAEAGVRNSAKIKVIPITQAGEQ